MIADAIDTRKRQALNAFTERLLTSSVSDVIARVVLYGSVARGEADLDSDVDVLLLTTGLVQDVDRVANEVAAEVWLEYGDRIEAMVYSSSLPIGVETPFAYRVLQEGQEVYRMSDETLPRTHNGVSNRFSDLFVRTAVVPREFGGKLTSALKLRKRARYDRHGDLAPAQVDETLKFAENMLTMLEKHLASTNNEQ